MSEQSNDTEAMLFAVVHDLRSPLRTILAACGALKDDLPSDLGPDGLIQIDRAESAANRMNAMLESLLEYARVGHSPMVIESVDLSQLVLEVAAEAGIPEGVVQISTTISLSADRERLRVAFSNLISNAWKFCQGQPSPKIDVSATITNTCVHVTVRDNGVGFDEAHASRLFEPFERLHHRGEFPGTGLGLASVRRIVTQHGGSVSASGKPGEGAQFVLVFPGTP